MAKIVLPEGSVDCVLECDDFINRYGLYYDDNGEEQFGVIGKIDVRAEVNSFKDSTDYSFIKKYLLSNPELFQDSGFYGERPPYMTDINEMKAYSNRLFELYDSLPSALKEKYKDPYEVVNGFSEEDYKLFQASDSSPASDQSDNKGE